MYTWLNKSRFEIFPRETGQGNEVWSMDLKYEGNATWGATVFNVGYGLVIAHQSG